MVEQGSRSMRFHLCFPLSVSMIKVTLERLPASLRNAHIGTDDNLQSLQRLVSSSVIKGDGQTRLLYPRRRPASSYLDPDLGLEPARPSLMLVPALWVVSAASLVRSCRRFMASSEASSPVMRSAQMDSSELEASSGFQWPLPAFCLERESCLCFSKASGLGSARRGFS